jgi:hypothetical protein
LARINKKRARELQKDAFRDKTLGEFEKLGNRLEGKGQTILYAIGGLIVAGILIWAFVSWRSKKNDEERMALGRAIEITEASVGSTQSASSSSPTYSSEKERSERAIAEFQKVSAKYGGHTRDLAQYFIAANLLTVDRAKGLSQLQALTNNSDSDISTRAKFALAGAYVEDNKLDEAAALYKSIAQANTVAVPPDEANYKLALVYEKQGKKSDAAGLLFDIVSASRKAQDKDGKPLPATAASRNAEKELEKIDPVKFAQLPPEPSASGFPT